MRQAAGGAAAGPADIVSDALNGTRVISVGEQTPRAKLFTGGLGGSRAALVSGELPVPEGGLIGVIQAEGKTREYK